MEALNIRNLTKYYGKIKAVSDLSLTVNEGMIYGFLGPNGSGKTTTLGIILGIINQNEGDYEWFGGRHANPRLKVGALLETPNFYPYLSAKRNLEIIAHIKKVKNPQIEKHLELVNLLHRQNHEFRTYSLGMKQRLAIAAALIGDPDLLIFDEPTNGLDPQGIAEVRETILKIAETGKTILMASHILDEVEKVCTHVAIIKNGVLLKTGPVGAILDNDKLIEVGSDNLSQLQSALEGQAIINRIDTFSDHLILSVEEEVTPQQINQLAFEKGIVLSKLAAKQKSLEEEFLEITNQN